MVEVAPVHAIEYVVFVVSGPTAALPEKALPITPLGLAT
jgi:hypothetical protein